MVAFSFITAFFVSKKLSFVTALVCWSSDKTLLLMRSASAACLRLNVYPDLLSAPHLPAYGDHREGVLLDLACPDADLILTKASSSRAFIHRYSWLLLDESPFNETVVDSVLANVDVLPDADVTWCSPDVSADLYRVKNNQPLIVTHLDLERNHDAAMMEAMWNQMPTAVSRRKDLRNVYFKSATIITQPQHFKGWSDLTNRQIDTYPKLTYPMMMLLGEDLNFRLVAVSNLSNKIKMKLAFPIEPGTPRYHCTKTVLYATRAMKYMDPTPGK